MRLTKNELIATNARLAAENEALRLQVSQLSADLERKNQQLLNVTSVASAVNTLRRNHDPVLEQRKAAMAAARELAMRSGRFIKVELDMAEPSVNEERRSLSNDISHVC